MPKKEFILYCDESEDKGKYCSHFYGGALIDGSKRQAIEKILNEKKNELNLYKELKWTNVTKPYLDKYIGFVDRFFDLIEEDLIKIRIMFIQNIYVVRGLDEYQIDNQYFLLYYQLIKHAFGLRYCNPEAIDNIHVKIYFDDIPDSTQKFDEFKNYLCALALYPAFKRAKINIRKDDLTDVRSHNHVILQGLDIIMGAMQFRLNEKHLEKPEGMRKRGNRTIAKEKLYKHINKRIRTVYHNFNIGCSTGQANGPTDKWNHPYRHWSFVPSEHQVDLTKAKSNK